jgi:Flp pilus assembly protein TadG
MNLRWRKPLCAKLWENHGQEIAEAALVLPLMFMILLGIFWFGQAFRIYGTLTHAARQGARAAVAPVCTSCTAANTPAQNAYGAVQSALLAAKLDPSQLSPPATIPTLCTCGSTDSKCTGGKTATCDVSESTICVQPNVQLSYTNATTSGAGVCGLSVSFQYPYSFWFPGTSLNKQGILLPAQAEMRAEQQ